MKDWTYQECATFYHTYLDAITYEGDVRDILLAQMAELQDLLRHLGEEKALFRYAPGKWSIKECLGHMIDTERVFAFRAMCFARGDNGPLPGMDQDQYVRGAGFDDRQLEDLLSEYRFLRQSSVMLFEGFSEKAGRRRGTASNCEFSARVFAWIIAGHERHHIKILKERYLG